MEKIKWILNQMPKNEDKNLAVMALDNVNQARKFHRSFPQYSVTPLAKLDGMAGQLGLGGSFAMAKYIAKEMGKDVSEMTYDYLTSKKFRDDFGQATFFTATDGNHGRGVAWAANKLGQKAVVHMPKGSTQTRFDNIAKEGASVTIEELNYVPEMPEKAKNIVIIGAGGIVSGSHLPAYKLASYPVVGIYDLNEERAKEVAKQFK